MDDIRGLYRRYAGDVYRFALYLSGDPATAEDIASESFVRLWTARERVDLPSLKGYLLAIARNLYLHERRRSRRRVYLDDAALESVPATGADPARETEIRAELQSVLVALQELPEVDRAALLMRVDEGLEYQEIAAALGISVSAAKVKVHRARLRLAERRAKATFGGTARSGHRESREES